MGRTTTYLFAVALGVAAALALVACGEEDAELLPGETAREITANLDTVNQLADEGDCIGAENAAEQVSEQVETLQGVDPGLQQALERGAMRLNEVVTECEGESTEPVPPIEVPETVPSTEDDKKAEADTKKEEAKQRKEDEAAEKEAERAEKEEEREDSEEEDPSGPPDEVPPPHSEGQGEGPSSGGVSPGSEVDEDED
jgi:outer membrane biosynthesis protein TonB